MHLALQENFSLEVSLPDKSMYRVGTKWCGTVGAIVHVSFQVFLAGTQVILWGFGCSGGFCLLSPKSPCMWQQLSKKHWLRQFSLFCFSLNQTINIEI